MATKHMDGEEIMQSVLGDKAAEGAYDPWKDMREIYVPKRTRGEQNTIKVLINSKSLFVPLDVRTEVPYPVYEVLMQSMEARREMEKNADGIFGGEAFPIGNAGGVR